MSIVDRVAMFVYPPAREGDSEEQRLNRAILVLMASATSLGGIVWGTVYLLLGVPDVSIWPYGYVVFSFINLVWYLRSKQYDVLRVGQLALILLVPTFLQWQLGGFSASGAVMLWAFLSPIVALVVSHSFGQARNWFFAFVALVLISGIFESTFAQARINMMSDFGISAFFVMNLLAPLTTTYFLVFFFIREGRKSTAAMNAQSKVLSDTNLQLNELNNTLETRVAERTVELKKSRDEALAAQRIANENSRLKSEFLSTMSHELRTPMNAIEGFTGIILKRMAGADYNEKAERYLKKIQSNSQRLLGLINDFLDLSRIESGRLELAHMPMSSLEMANKWRENLSSLAENKGLEFEVEVDPNLPETMFGDEEFISKIAINLVGNAIKFTETGSVSVTLRRLDEHMELQVRDTGIGIPPHARDFIFEEFRQVDQTSKRQYGGTGLGLAIVQKLTRAMGGTITVQSEVGVGSTFTVLIPILTETARELA